MLCRDIKQSLRRFQHYSPESNSFHRSHKVPLTFKNTQLGVYPLVRGSQSSLNKQEV